MKEEITKSLGEIASEKIIKLIVDDNLKIGDRLPNEYELADKLGVGRSTVREAIKATIVEDVSSKYEIKKDESVEDIIKKLTDEMLKCATNMEFEKAAELRDKIKELEKLI